MKSSTIDLERLLRRLHLPTVRRLYADLEARAEKEEMSYRDYLAILIAEEVAHRGETRVRRSVHQARFPFLATIEQFDFTYQSSVRLSLLGSALGPELISEGRTMVLCGPSGTGKTHLAIAIAYKAIQNGGTAVFREANHLIEELSEATGRGTLRQAIEPYLHTDVLVIDELGYLTYPQDAANVLFQVVNQRYLQKKAIVVTTNKPLDKWASVLHDRDLAEAIIDRVLARGRLIELRGASYRTRHLKTKDDGTSSPDQSARVSGISGPDFSEPTPLSACHGRELHPFRQRCSRKQFRLERDKIKKHLIDVRKMLGEVARKVAAASLAFRGEPMRRGPRAWTVSLRTRAG
jgi:DNA replication protein DnaC